MVASLSVAGASGLFSQNPDSTRRSPAHARTPPFVTECRLDASGPSTPALTFYPHSFNFCIQTVFLEQKLTELVKNEIKLSETPFKVHAKVSDEIL